VDMFQALATSELSATVVNSQNKYGDTPIVCATRAGHFEILALLISYNADASITNFTGENALHFLVNLDDGNVPAAAQLLVGAGAAMDAEATAFTGNTCLEMKPFGKGCPKLRAVLFDKALVLRTLLDLEKFCDSRRLNISERTPASTQRFMLAWALRLHHVGILNVLEEYFCSSSVFHNMAQIYIWNNGRRHSLPELCILGCSSANSMSSFDMSEKFLRILIHGTGYRSSLESYLAFIAKHQPGLLARSCPGSRNALFFAIKEGRRDATRFLACDYFSLFVRAENRNASRTEMKK